MSGTKGYYNHMNFRPPTKRLAALCAALFVIATGARADVDYSGASARPSPDWLRRGTIYQIFPRHFSAAGNLAAVTARLDDLQKLGVTVLWTMPIHPIGEKFRKGEFGSPYAIRDYYAVDPHYGTLADYRALVAGAHQRGMKVIMDLVANHTAWDSVMMTNRNFYKQDASGHVVPPVPSWTDVAGLNYANPDLRRYMIAMLKFWIKECDVDGFRCDVAGMVPTDFWEQVRDELSKVKPDIMMLSEEARKPEYFVKAFDIDYAWPLLWTMNQVLVHGAPAAKIRESWEETRRQFPKGALHMRISDDHDEDRAVARYGLNGALAASALMFTLDGVPLIYNGMEYGDATASSDPALFEKYNIQWNDIKERPPLRAIYHDLIQLRKQYAAFRTSDINWLHNTDEKKLVSFIRADEKDEFLVVINFSNQPLTAKVELENSGGFSPLKISGYADADDGPLPSVYLEGFQWRIYHRAANAVAKK